MADTNDFNARIIAEFRENRGQLGGQFAGFPMLLLHTTGARSGKAYVNPMTYQRDGDRYHVFASFGGAEKNPAWYHNLRAHPEVRIEIGTETLDVHATDLVGPERDEVYARQVELYPVFAQYQAKTARTIPVIALTPVATA